MTAHYRPPGTSLTGNLMRKTRKAMGFTTYELGELLGFAGGRDRAGDRVRLMENGHLDISGPVARLMEALSSGWRPEDWRAEHDPRD